MALQMKVIEGHPEEQSGVNVGWDDYRVSRNGLWTDGIGPCLAIALYAPEVGKGALAHISGQKNIPYLTEAVYPENIVTTLLSQIGDYQIEAVLAGESERPIKISDRIKKDLLSLQIPIVGEDLGDVGYRGREVHFNCRTGEIQVYRLPSQIF